MSVLATIEPAELAVDPGAEASLVVRVRNRGSIVDRFDISVVGPTAGWAFVDQPSLRLFPDKEGEARVSFRPPRAPNPAADVYTFGVSVRAASDVNASTVEEGRITVAPFVQLTTDIVPQTSRGSRAGSHDVTVHNIGNAVAEIAVKASDPDRLLDFEVSPARAGLRPDATATIRARVKPKQTFLFGAAKRLPFTVQVDEPTAGSYQVPASLEQRAIIPSWVKPAAGLAVAAIAALAFLPPILFPPAPSVAPSAVGGNATPEPTIVATPAPITAPPTPGPTPSPGINEPIARFVASGDVEPINPDSGLVLKCERGESCRETAKTLLEQVLVNLQGKADGVALIDFDNTPTGTLPLLAEWNDAIYQYSAAGGLKGETNRVRVDLAPFLAGFTGYLLLDDTLTNQTYKFVLPPGDGLQLFNALYTYTPEVLPTPPPIDTGVIDYGDLVLDRGWVFGIDWAIATPPP
jgi:hypothetical protein